MNGLVSIGAVIAMLLGVGAIAALVRPGRVRWRWLLAAAAAILVNDALLTRVYRTIPDFLPTAEWNWQGKLLALAVTLLVAALPAIGWRTAGLTLRQAPRSLVAVVPVTAIYAALFVALALMRPEDPATPEALAFQMTMPGIEEESFYRGLLLLLLERAFAGRRRFLGVDWSLGALLSCAIFGLAHAFSYGDEGFAFEPMFMALTAFPSLLAVWIRLRTGSVLIPILLHNFGNTIGFLI
ncbi:CPBP family intramembrane metalloprotease [Sphingomonas sp. NBWT7]|uniref:CPBP family intramembrane glutamic endopeptidase, BDIM_20840 family n=1 Tax=Sphingomonas sp. NBWT7 TaxID=2596913 RepID=UPI0016232AE2|nr:CPBP family intramembrane glutamic endopeptidase [Sphingomonas sp. NBWT7]QNE31804.1 CPBP family intramembrane metalloprotease [Sphingomonas sp. NBWT7]